MMTKQYYDSGKHEYMLPDKDKFAELVFSKLSVEKLHSHAIEIGAGMGRFSCPLIQHFDTVDLVEPVPAYAGMLKTKHSTNGVSIYEEKLSTYLRDFAPRDSVSLFCFHVLHHLTLAEREEIYAYVAETNSIGFAVEPNPFNPLLPVQIVCNPHMSFKEEHQYFMLTKNRYSKELKKFNLKLYQHKRICFFPPAIYGIFTNNSSRVILNLFEMLNTLPFCGSYHYISFGKEQ